MVSHSSCESVSVINFNVMARDAWHQCKGMAKERAMFVYTNKLMEVRELSLQDLSQFE
jgi:hypothetical protein